MAIKSKVTLSYHFSTKNFIIIIPQHKLQYKKDILYDKNNIKKHKFSEEKKLPPKYHQCQWSANIFQMMPLLQAN